MALTNMNLSTLVQPKWKWGYSGMTALLLLSVYVTLTTIPKEGRFLRATMSTNSFPSVASLLGSATAVEQSQSTEAATTMDNGVVVPSNEFFVTPNVDLSPKIALLMSFPNSGTSYTITLIRHLTMTSTATNYGHELDDGRPSVPVYDDQPNGPFWYEPLTQSSKYTRPTKYVVTKTHCGLRCEQCPPQNYVETTFSFRRNCLSGGRINATGHKELKSYYPMGVEDRLTKAIHLIRDPFDNIVSRFHLERRKKATSNSGMEQQAVPYEATKDGFLAFCRDMNKAHGAEEDRAPFIHQSILAILQDVPCRADFIRFIEWHNLAFATTSDMGLETYVLYYDWYASRFDETVKELVGFLDLTVRAEPEPFVAGKVYRDYFTEEQRGRVKLAMEAMASTESWKHMVRYFDD